MRRVTFSPNSPPPGQEEFWQKWVADSTLETEAMFERYQRGHAVQADNDALWGRLKSWFLTYVFANKCAYCEGDSSAHAPQHAEHWRPKGAVTRPAKDGTQAIVERNGIVHPGYWWIAYRWENLVPSCFFCNTAKAKGTKFPIGGQYVFSPEEGMDLNTLNDRERPWLLHPFGGPNPEDHIGFNSDGTAFAKNKSEYGYWTITVMDLNRERLVNARRERQESAVDAFGQAASDAIRTDVSIDERMDKWEGSGAVFSRAVRDHLAPIRENVGPQIYKAEMDPSRRTY